MKRSVIALALLGGLLMAAPTKAAASISVDQPPPYHWGDTITVTVVVPKLKGYEYPVVQINCTFPSRTTFIYWRRWDTEGPLYPWGSGPEPIVLSNGTEPAVSVDCTVELWAYAGLNHPPEHKLAETPIHIDP